MITLDNRTGSGDLYPILRRRRLPVKLGRLPFGDAAFIGQGRECPVYIGVEVKRVTDVLQCITDGRFSGHQLPGLVSTYNYCWLVVEGSYKADDEGILVMRKWGKWIEPRGRRFMVRDLEHWLLTMQLRAGIRVKSTWGREETAQFIGDLYKWWTGKEWAEHRAHLSFDESGTDVDTGMLVKPGLKRRVAKELPHIGWVKSGSVSRHFSTVEQMVNADITDWANIEGVGEKIAVDVWKALRGMGGKNGQ